MKKLALLLITVGLILFSISPAQAASIYLERLIGASWDSELNGSPYEGDLSGTTIGIEESLDSIKLGFEYMDSAIEGDTDGDISIYDLKCGYPLLDQNDLKLYGTLSIFNSKMDGIDINHTTINLGVDLRYDLLEKLYLDALVNFSVYGSAEISSKDYDSDLLNFKAKLNYLINNNVGFLIGYRYLKFETDWNDYKMDTSGLIAGLSYNF